MSLLSERLPKITRSETVHPLLLGSDLWDRRQYLMRSDGPKKRNTVKQNKQKTIGKSQRIGHTHILVSERN